MKTIKFILSIIGLGILASCGGGTDTNDVGYSPAEAMQADMAFELLNVEEQEATCFGWNNHPEEAMFEAMTTGEGALTESQTIAYFDVLDDNC